MREEFKKMVKEGFSDGEIKAAKSGYLQSRQVTRAQDNSLTSRLNQYQDLNRTMAWDADFEKKLEALTPEQVNAAMKKHVDYEKLTIVKAGDFEKAAQKAAEKQGAAAVGGAKKN